MRLESEVEQIGIFGIKIVVFRFDPRIVDRLNLYVQSERDSGLLDLEGEIVDAKHLGKLVEDAELPGFGRIGDRQFHAPWSRAVRT